MTAFHDSSEQLNKHLAMAAMLQAQLCTMLLLCSLAPRPPRQQEVDYLGRPLHSQQHQRRVRAFIPAGRHSSPELLLRGRAAGGLLAALDASLSKAWPHSFIKVKSLTAVLIDTNVHAVRCAFENISSTPKHELPDTACQPSFAVATHTTMPCVNSTNEAPESCAQCNTQLMRACCCLQWCAAAVYNAAGLH